VLPVTHLPGGTTAALQRWQQFKVHGLHLYAARRNDALQREGVSRLSAYHHYGMVSPFQVAREAKFSGGVAGVKFLDEFLVWREIAYHFCFHRWALFEALWCAMSGGVLQCLSAGRDAVHQLARLLQGGASPSHPCCCAAQVVFACRHNHLVQRMYVSRLMCIGSTTH
jgi:hypothetical protein